MVWLSLLIIPILIIYYGCYAGLCNGPEVEEIKKNHSQIISLLGYVIWIYPLIVFYSLFHSRKKAKRVLSTEILWLPLICLVFIIWGMYQIT